MRRKLFALLLISSAILGWSCGDSPRTAEIQNGTWMGYLGLSGGEQIPFVFEVAGSRDVGYTWTLINGPERQELMPFKMDLDTFKVYHPVFDSELRGILRNDSLIGNFLNRARVTKNVIPFYAVPSAEGLFASKTSEPEADLSGRWKSKFVYRKRDTTEALGIFQQEANGELKGTFRTATGDYRYLNGKVYGDRLYLTTFDMAHAFLFKARLKDEQLQGEFWSGDHWYETWSAVRNPDFSLPSPDSLTFLKEGYDKLEFTFPNFMRQPVSLTDPAYNGKVVIVQIMGTWCPNCRDETMFLNDYYKKNYPRGLEVVALAFEVAPDPEDGLKNVARYVSHFDLKYEVLMAGLAGPKAAESLPMLNHIMSYPTTIFLDRKGRVRRIHTGFNGPATGEKYDEFVEDFNALMDKLLAEPA